MGVSGCLKIMWKGERNNTTGSESNPQLVIFLLHMLSLFRKGCGGCRFGPQSVQCMTGDFKALWATMTDRWFQLPGIVRTTGQNNFGYLRSKMEYPRALLEIWLLNMRIFRPCYILRGWQVTHLRKAEHMECLTIAGQLGTIQCETSIPWWKSPNSSTGRSSAHEEPFCWAQVCFKEVPQ